MKLNSFLKASGHRVRLESLKEIVVACGSENLLALRKSKGSPNHSEQVEMILHNKMRLINFRDRTAKRKKAIDKACDDLSKIVRSYGIHLRIVFGQLAVPIGNIDRDMISLNGSKEYSPAQIRTGVKGSKGLYAWPLHSV